MQGKPIIVFHGGNATTVYNLLACDFLLEAFNVYAVDIIGHPVKSVETSLSPLNYDYGKWTSEIFSEIGIQKICMFGGSFGAGVIVKTMCVIPDKIEKAVLYVPSGISNAASIKSMNMLLPMIKFWMTRKDKWLRQCILPMAIKNEMINDDIYQTAKLSIENEKIKKIMPSNVNPKLLKKCSSPVLVIGAEKDCLFPGKKIISKAERILPDVKNISN